MSDYSEFFLNAGSNIVELETLEISHLNFTKTYYLVRNAVYGISAKDENGVTRTFDYYPLQITAVGSGDDLDQAIRIQLGDLGDVLPKELEAVQAANGFQIKPSIIYRTYRSDDLNSPLYGPIILQAGPLTFKKEGAAFEASAPRLNTSSTGELYTTNRFTMLRGFI